MKKALKKYSRPSFQ